MHRIDPKIAIVSVNSAFAELGPLHFGIWVRLTSVSQFTLSRGINAVAKHLGLPARTLARHLARLREHEFIMLKNHGSGRRAEVLILRRPMLIGPVCA